MTQKKGCVCFLCISPCVAETTSHQAQAGNTATLVIKLQFADVAVLGVHSEGDISAIFYSIRQFSGTQERDDDICKDKVFH